MGTKLANRARKARERAGFEKESQAAKAIGCSRPLVISWENGQAGSIGAKYLLAAARAYKVRPEWLSLQTDDDGYPWQAPQSQDDEQLRSNPLRPDPTMMAAAYEVALYHFGVARLVAFFHRPEHMEVVCEAYRLLAAGVQDLRPGADHADSLTALVHRLSDATGGARNVSPIQGRVDSR